MHLSYSSALYNVSWDMYALSDKHHLSGPFDNPSTDKDSMTYVFDRNKSYNLVSIGCDHFTSKSLKCTPIASPRDLEMWCHLWIHVVSYIGLYWTEICHESILFVEIDHNCSNEQQQAKHWRVHRKSMLKVVTDGLWLNSHVTSNMVGLSSPQAPLMPS